MTTASDVERWLQMGLGRAFLVLREDPALAPQEMILEACLHNQARDRQVEGNRASYMYTILELYKNEATRWAFFRNAIVEALESFDNTSDDYDVEQVYWLVHHYADDGDQAAKEALYRHFEQYPILAGYVGAIVLILLDGIDGFVHAVERIHDVMDSDIDQYDRSYICPHMLDTLEEKVGTQRARTALDMLRVTNAKVAYFFRPFSNSTRQPRVVEQMPYSELQAQLRSGVRHPIAPSEWAKTATPADLEAAAEDLINRTTPPSFLLRVFWFVEFPQDSALLFPFTDDANGQVRAASFGALKQVTSPSIRDFALECIARDHQIGLSIGLLEKYHVSTDWQLFERLSQRELDPEDYHGLGFPIFDIFDAHPSPDAENTFLHLYERMPCATCRERIVERLHMLGAFPSWMREECRYDSLDRIRDWVKAMESKG